MRGEEDVRLADAIPSSNSSSSIAAFSSCCSSVIRPQPWGPPPSLRMCLSVPDFDSERSLEMARGNEERAVRVMVVMRKRRR